MFLALVWTVLTVGVSATVLMTMFVCLRRSGVRFNFRITDLYAAVLCLSPAMAALGYAVQGYDPQQRDAWYWIWLSGLVLANQVLGLAIGRIDIQLPPHDRNEPTALESAVSIFVGSMYGLMLAVIFLFFLLYFGVRMAVRVQEVFRILRERESVLRFRRPAP